jgi:ATP-binding cassette subfamily C protein LapB
MDGRISVGALAACTFLAGRAAQPLLRALGVWTQFQNVRIAREQVRAIFDLPAEDRVDIAAGHAVGGALRLEGVSFGYGADQRDVLDGISLDIRAGEAVGITGNNGAGKTTLLWLVLGLLKPGVGRVLMDGIDVRSHDPAMLCKHVAYLPQNGVLFQGTILDNLTMFEPARAERAKQIAAQLGLAEIIGRLPKGYDTVLNDSPDEGLPVGVRQRIAIVRALVPLDEPRLIVFDEANGYLDQASDEMFRRLLVDLRGRCTLVLASHRPSYLALADRTYVLRDGTLHPSSSGAREALQTLEAGLTA